MKALIQLILPLVFILSSTSGISQTFTIKADSLLHIYEGGGTSFGLYGGHHRSLTEANQDSVMRWLFKDCNMLYVQQYFGGDPRIESNQTRYINFTSYVKDAKAKNPSVMVSMVMNNIPDAYMTTKLIDGEEEEVLDLSIVDVYDSLALWYFNSLQIMHDNGVEVDIFNMVNEPDWNKPERFGYSDKKQGVALLIENVVPKLESLLADAGINSDNLEMPKIMAPSTLSPYACYNYITEWITNYPVAWSLVDIVGTHQYASGSGNKDIYENIKELLDGRGFIQSEQHTNRGDDIGDPPIEKEHRGILSLGQVFSAGVSGGLNSWMYFQANYPQDFHNGGLLQIKWAGTPYRWKTYWAFNQLNTLQSDSAYVLHANKSGASNIFHVAFRKPGTDTLYLHLTNNNGEVKSSIIEVLGDLSAKYGISSVRSWKTDDKSDMEYLGGIEFSTSVKDYRYNLAPYSLTSLEIVLDNSGYGVELQDQSINFNAIPDKLDSDPDFNLTAEATSGLPVSFRVESGPATINGNKVSLLGSGEVTIVASQIGDDNYYQAQEISQSFNVSLSSMPDPVIWYPFNDNANDSMNYIHSELRGAEIIIDSTIGKVVSMDTNKYISLSPDVLNDTFSISLWVNRKEENEWKRIFEFYKDDDNYFNLSPSNYKKLRTEFVYNGEKFLCGHTEKIPLPYNEWSHLVVVVNGYDFKLYHNNSLIGEITSTAMISDLQIDSATFGFSARNGRYSVAYLDDVRIYHHALGAAEVDFLYNEMSGDIALESIVIGTLSGSDSVFVNGSIQMTTDVFPKNASDTTVSWSVINGSGEATISETGMLKATATGVVTVKVIANIDPQIVDSMEVYIIDNNDDVEIESINVTSLNNSDSVSISETLKMVAVITPEDATNKDVLWSVDELDGSATISTDGELTPATTGKVLVIATAKSNCEVTGEKEIIIYENNATSITPLLPGNLEIYPNPAYDYISIEAVVGEGKIDILSLNGKLVFSQQVTNQESIFIDISELQSGTYIVRVLTDFESKLGSLIIR